MRSGSYNIVASEGRFGRHAHYDCTCSHGRNAPIADAANGVVATAPVATATVAAAAAADGAGEGLLTTNTSSANGKASSASSDDVAMVTDDAAAASERQPMAAPHAPASTQRQPPGEGEPMRVTIDSNMRLRWSPQLHQHFCNAVAALGGSAFAKVWRLGAAVPPLCAASARLSPSDQHQTLATTTPSAAAQGHCVQNGGAWSHVGPR